MAKARRRSRKRQRKKTDRLLWVVVGASFTLVTVFLATRTGDGVAPTGEYHGGSFFSTTSTYHLEECRSSCDRKILSVAFPSPVASTALASSAVDALFLLRDDHENASKQESEEHSGDDRPENTARTHDDGDRRRRDDNRGEAASQQSSPYEKSGGLTEKPIHSNHRPTRLPPLIEILIGTVEETHPTGEILNKRSLVRREDDAKRKPSPSGRRKRADDYGAGGDDAVQMAAAAAAAAVWSDPARSAGKHRMKTINADWDASLRWIAGWGPQQHGGGHIERGERSRRGELQHGSGHSREGGKASREGGYSADNAETKSDDLWMMYDLCVEECLGQMGQKRNYDGPDDLASSGFLQQELFAAGTNLLMKWMTFISGGTERGSFSSDGRLFVMARHEVVVVAIARLVLSSVALYAIRSLWLWRSFLLSLPSSSSCKMGQDTRWLMEDEAFLATDHVNARGDRHHCSAGSKKKGTSSKRSRRKKNRKGTSSYQQQRCRNEVVHVTSETTAAQIDDSSNVSFSSQESISSKEKVEVEPKLPSALIEVESMVDSNIVEDPIAHEGRHSTSTQEVEEQIAVDGVSFSSVSFESPHRGPLSQISLSSSSDSDVSSPRLQPIGSGLSKPSGKSTSDEIFFERQARGEMWRTSLSRHFKETPTRYLQDNIHTPDDRNECFISPYLRSQVLVDQQRSTFLSVPTEKQRQEASRQLREFQRMQIQRIMLRRARSFPHKNCSAQPKSDCYSIAAANEKKTSPKSVSYSAAVSSSSTREVAGPVISPPGFAVQSTQVNCRTTTREDISMSCIGQADAGDCLTHEELLLSDMLEDDQDDGEARSAIRILGDGKAAQPPNLGGNEAARESFAEPPSKGDLSQPWVKYPPQLLSGHHDKRGLDQSCSNINGGADREKCSRHETLTLRNNIFGGGVW